MTAALGVATSGSALWFLSRGTGIVSLGLLTLVMVLGVLTRPPGLQIRNTFFQLTSPIAWRMQVKDMTIPV